MIQLNPQILEYEMISIYLGIPDFLQTESYIITRREHVL
jgi:hypothetical protein